PLPGSLPGLPSSGAIPLPRAARTPLCVGCIIRSVASEQPLVHLRNAMLGERQVAVLGSEPRLDTRDVLGKPDSVAVGHELVLLPCRTRTGTRIDARSNPHGRR